MIDFSEIRQCAQTTEIPLYKADFQSDNIQSQDAVIVKLGAETEAIAKAKAVYDEHQRLTKKAEAAQISILQGIREGQDAGRLLLQACDCIAALTGNKQFYRQAEADYLAIHGVLESPGAMSVELERLEGRLERLQSALERTEGADSRKRIMAAVQAHRRRIEQIREIL